tara:strand:- start:20 stop:151 length:132 start_codon:yes stop_codon:yes gene_type:complete
LFNFSFKIKNSFLGNAPSSNFSIEIFVNPFSKELTFFLKNNGQ